MLAEVYLLLIYEFRILLRIEKFSLAKVIMLYNCLNLSESEKSKKRFEKLCALSEETSEYQPPQNLGYQMKYTYIARSTRYGSTK